MANDSVLDHAARVLLHRWFAFVERDDNDNDNDIPTRRRRCADCNAK